MTQTWLHWLAQRVSAQIGLAIDPSRHEALRSALESGGQLLRCIESPLAREDIERLSWQLSVGETYFFREPAAFEALEGELLPSLIAARRRTGRRLRLWSAGCCTGEEAYSLAITLARLLPDLDEWDIRIVGTDIHPGYLERAREGVYGEWSFRGVPASLRERCFECRGPGRHAVLARLRRLVEFGYGNLAQEAPAASAFDVVLCRHVLMYFEPVQAQQALLRIADAVAPDGWLLLSSAEDGLARGSPLAATRVGQATFHRRAPAAAEMPVACPALRAAPERAAPLAVLGHLRRCERALAVDRCDASLHCLHAGLLQALGELQSAREALRRSLFLDSEFLPAHMALVRLGRLQGDRRLARRHLALARRLLDRRRTCAS